MLDDPELFVLGVFFELKPFVFALQPEDLLLEGLCVCILFEVCLGTHFCWLGQYLVGLTVTPGTEDFRLDHPRLLFL